jgi:hypothetical protein
MQMNRPISGRQDYVKLAIVGLALVIAVFVLAEFIGWFECRGCDQKDIAKAISDVRASLLQVIVGVAGAVAIYFTWQTYLLGRESRASDNFIKAIDQLGNQAVHARVGGVVGLGRLLRTATVDGDYWPLMDVLTAFVRQSIPAANTPPRVTKPSEDIQAAIDELARRSHSEIPSRTGNSPVDLSECDLSYLWMAGGHYEGGYFPNSVFRNTDLSGASLRHTNFDRTDLTNAKFDGAEMHDACIRWVKSAQGASFRGATLRGADFEGSDLRGTSFEDADVRGADFSKAIVEEPTLREAISDSHTKLPTGFSRPTSSRRS